MDTLSEIKGLFEEILQETTGLPKNSSKTDTKLQREPISGETNDMPKLKNAGIDETLKSGPESPVAIDDNVGVDDIAPDLDEEAPEETMEEPMLEEEAEESEVDLEEQILEALGGVLVNNPDLTAEDLVNHLKEQLEDGGEDEMAELDEGLPEEGSDMEIPGEDVESPEEEAEEVDEFGPEEAEESPEEEEAEHKFKKKKPETDEDGDGEEDEEEEEAEFPFQASYVRKASVKDSYWEVKSNNQSIMKVSGAQAFGAYLDKKPNEKDYPKSYATYGDVFKSKDYGDVLLYVAKNQGIKKACESANGTLLVKEAQIGPGSVSPQGGPGARATEEQPYNQGITDISNQAPTEGGKDTNFNPSAAAEEDMLNGGEEKLMVSDMLIGFMAMLIANRDYSVDEIMNELATTFTDEGSTAEFRGALKEKAENYASGSTADEEELDPQLDIDTATSGVDDGSMGAAGMSPDAKPNAMAGDEAVSEGGMKVGAEKKIAELEQVVDHLLEKDSLRMKVASCVEFVKTHMQTRGVDNVPVVPTAEYLMDTQGLNKEAAVAEETKLVYEKAKELVHLNDAGWKQLTDNLNILHVVEKTASITTSQEGLGKSASKISLGLFMENDVATSKFDHVLPEDAFKTRVTDTARKANAERAAKRKF